MWRIDLRYLLYRSTHVVSFIEKDASSGRLTRTRVLNLVHGVGALRALLLFYLIGRYIT
eukprot:SAG11_NODE_37560_length_256_cov_0.974522_1_plen_58_part_01